MSKLANVYTGRPGPLVSVVVPAHNSEAYIRDALSSLLDQTLGDFEIVVVDDASTDATGPIVKAYADRDPRIRLISRSTASGRPACARNEGLRAARGRYIALLDGDDIAIPTRLASAVEAMETTGAQFAFADYRRFYESTGEVDTVGMLESAQFVTAASPYLEQVGPSVYVCDSRFPAFLLTFTAVHTPTVVFHRDLLAIETTWFDESLVCFEDVDLWFRWANRARFVFVNEVHALYRRHSGSITAGRRIETMMDGIRVRTKHLERLRSRLSPAEVAAAEKNIAELLVDVGYLRWCSGEGKSARSAFLDSWNSSPSASAATGWLKSLVPRQQAVSAVGAIRQTLGMG